MANAYKTYRFAVWYKRDIRARSKDEAYDKVSHTPVPDDYVESTQESELLEVDDDNNPRVLATFEPWIRQVED
jgi:hypothetical protein